MIQGCVICYNDTPALVERCLKSLRTVADTLLVVDGPFESYPHEANASTDGTLEKARELADEVITRPVAWRSQMDKRNAYLTLKNIHDYYLWIDTDEYIEGKLPELKEDYYAIPVVTDGNSEYQVRCFRNQKGLKYKKKHSWLWLDGNIVSQDISNSNIVKLDTVRIIHTPNARTQEKLEKDLVYTQMRNFNEEPQMSITDVVPMRKNEVLKGARLICLEQYSGFDFDSSYLNLQANEEFNCSERKATQLLTDFPTQFKRI